MSFRGMSSAARKVTRATEGQGYGSNDPTGLNPLGGMTNFFDYNYGKEKNQWVFFSS